MLQFLDDSDLFYDKM